MADPNLSAVTLHDFVVQDFHHGWDALETWYRDHGREVGGNFMFASRAMVLIELACRVCSHDDTGAKLRRFGEELEAIEPRYFTPLPGHVPNPMTTRADEREWRLPASATQQPEENQLLRAIFDLGRNGLSHLNQQTMVRLQDGRWFGLSWTGVGRGALAKLAADSDPDHLCLDSGAEGVLMVLSPGLLFLDLERAISRAGVYQGEMPSIHWDRSRKYSFSSTSAEQKLVKAGHEHRRRTGRSE